MAFPFDTLGAWKLTPNYIERRKRMGTPKLSIEVSEISVQLSILSERLDQREKRLLRDIEALQSERRQVVNSD